MTKPTRPHAELANTLRSIDPSLAPSPGLAPSRTADAVPVRSTRYTLGAEIAQGATSTIYQAFDVLLHRRVALKVLHPTASGDAERRRRFVEDAKATAELDHAGIVPVHDIGELPDGRTFVAMRLLPGKSLTRGLDELRGRGSEARALLRLLRVFVRVGETVAFAHSRGVIHRDVQPNNVLLGHLGEVFVLDWGLFKWNPMPLLRRAGLAPSDVGDAPDRRRRAAGKKPLSRAVEPDDAEMLQLSQRLPYMSPEEVNGEGLDTLSDVYGLGAVLYAILCGEAPVESVPGETLVELVERVKSASRPLASERRHGSRANRVLPWRVSSTLQAICARALSVTRDQRHPSALALVAEVTAYLDGKSLRES